MIKLSLLDDVLYPLVLTFARIAIIFQVLYAFVLPQTRYTGDYPTKNGPVGKLMARFAIGFNGSWCLFAILISVLRCIPFSAYWEEAAHETKCLNQKAVALSVTLLDLVCSVITGYAVLVPSIKVGAWTNIKVRLALVASCTIGYVWYFCILIYY